MKPRYRIKRIMDYEQGKLLTYIGNGLINFLKEPAYKRPYIKLNPTLRPIDGYHLCEQGYFKITPIQSPTINTLPQ